MSEVEVEPGLVRVGGQAARRLERNGLRASGRLKLLGVTQEEVGALSGLLGGRWRAPLAGADASIDLAALDAALRASTYGCSLATLAAAVDGAPLVDRGANRRARLDARQAGWAVLLDHPGVAERPRLASWLERERASGAVLRAGTSDPLAVLGDALRLVALLPADPPVSLVRFAAAHCGGDPHALDRDRALDGVLRRALGHLDDEPVAAVGAAARRERYERWGLGCDELSTTVLTLGLHPPGNSALEEALRLASGAGQPRVLTLRELGEVTALRCGARVFTCENPDVVSAAAERLVGDCLPLICTEGWPSAACLRLLRALQAGGAAMAHHGDMDAAGLRILDHLIARTDGEPWRMTASDHAAHAEGGVAAEAGTLAEVRAPGLRAVADAIASSGRLVREEQTLGTLLEDLRRPGHR